MGGQKLEHAPAEDPATYHLLEYLNRLDDAVAQAADERMSHLPPPVPYRVERAQSLFDLAASLNQDVVLLLELNAGSIADPLWLPIDTIIQVFSDAEAA